jgi:metallo-beta-lactamase class B
VIRFYGAALCAALLAGGITSDANGQSTSAAQAHVAAAAADVSPSTANAKPWQTYSSMFKLICSQPKAGAKAPFVGTGEPEEKEKLVATPRDQWYVPPVRVFDNLYYIGTQTESTWALTTSAGIILLNTNFPWVTPELVNELKTFGLDPANIKYAIVVRSHSDQSWGINPLKKMVPSAHVIMSAIDWDLLAKDNSPASVKPTRDMVAYDGEKLTLGDTTVTLYSTPTSTPGNLSIIFPLKDGNQRHTAGMLGGDFMRLVQEGVQMFPDMAAMSTTYIASSQRFKDLEDKAGVDAIIHIHAEYDNTLQKLDAVRARKPGDPNPFVNKDDVDRFMNLHIECAQAQLAWAQGSSSP